MLIPLRATGRGNNSTTFIIVSTSKLPAMFVSTVKIVKLDHEVIITWSQTLTGSLNWLVDQKNTKIKNSLKFSPGLLQITRDGADHVPQLTLLCY